VSVVGFVKGMDAGRHGLIFVGIVLLPYLASTWMLLRWTDGEAIDERLSRIAGFNAFMLVILDIALLVVMLDNRKRGGDCYECGR
jgi:hypothetical protein